jgi:lysophospholipase L1-like esterase
MHWWRIVATCLLGATLALSTAASAGARERDAEDGQYLALGDSVAFGTNPLLDRANAANFIGYPEALAHELELNVTNASCPGEASGGFISLTGTDNVCRPYRANFPLHVSYATSQLDFAVSFLESHRHTRLVTINIGANDLFVLQKLCKAVTTCVVDGLPGLLSTLSANLDTIYSRLRGEAHYRHQIVALTYYSTNYNDPVGMSVIQAINGTVAAATLKAGGKVADGFGAFKAVADSKGGGDACVAGLVIRLSPTTCDIHPSPLGHDALAHAVRAALAHHEADGDNRDG